MLSSAIIKILVLMFLGIGIHHSIKVQLYQGLYEIQYSIENIPDINKFRVHIQENQIVIQGGCNIQTTTFWIQEGSIKLDDWSSTEKLCNDDHDQKITEIFSKAATISTYAGKAYLYNSKGVKLLKLKKIQ